MLIADNEFESLKLMTKMAKEHGRSGVFFRGRNLTFEEAEKEIKMPMLFDTREQAEKEAYKFGCEGAHQMGNKWMPCSMHKHNH